MAIHVIFKSSDKKHKFSKKISVKLVMNHLEANRDEDSLAVFSNLTDKVS